jgi:predicted Rossmann fold flavoprotein
MYDLIIIGGGAAGLFLAANLSGKKVLLLEKMAAPGKKMLISGGGMCNLTNCDTTEDFILHFGDRKKANFIKPALLNLSTAETRNWFEERNLPLVVREDGKVFPATLKSSALVDHLVKTARMNNVEIRTNEPVSAVSKDNDVFSITAGNRTFLSKRVVLTTGGKSYESTGSDGSGYALARSLGHSIVEPTQALVAVNLENTPFVSLAGNSIRNAAVDFYRENDSKRYLSATGDLLFTHKGISGPVILNNSRYIRKNDSLNVSLIPTENKEKSRMELLDALSRDPKKKVASILKAYGVFSGLSEILLTETGLAKEITCSHLQKKPRNSLISLLLDYPLKVSRKGYFSSAMVTAGGIDLNEINRKTMESKIIEKLFVAGEILDIDGDTGGYNIQAAFSTAFLIASVLK